MGLSFLRDYGGHRLPLYEPQPELLINDDGQGPEVEVGYEVRPDQWRAIALESSGGQPWADWPSCPTRFVDGKDVGETVAVLRAPAGFLVPVRLSQIGSTVICVADSLCRRESAEVERVVSLVTEPFPWNEVESFAIALQERGMRLLSASMPTGENASPYDFETMRKAAQNRTNDEMAGLEALAVSRASDVPTVVDGRLEPRSGGFDRRNSTVTGVIKTPYEMYLPVEQHVLQYHLEPGERTPVFAIGGSYPVVTWYLRFVEGMPNYGVVRVELPREWFEITMGRTFEYVDRLSLVLYAYRCRERSYGRADISLHPIVRAEQTLGALFHPLSLLTSRFYRMTQL